MIKKIQLLILLSLAATQAFAAEGGGIRVAVGGLGGLTGARDGASNPAQVTGFSTSRKWSWGGGLLLEAPIAPMFGLEVGGLYVARKFELGNDTIKVERTVPTVFVPVELRFWLFDFASVAGGGFAAFRVGRQSDELKSGGTTLGSISSDNRESTELGFTLAATLNVATINKTGIFVEGRYNHGFTNASKDTLFEERIDDFLFMAGVRIDLSNY